MKGLTSLERKANMDILGELRAAALSQLGVMEALRWFTPTDQFWTHLEPYKNQKFVDCGCGTGALVGEARQRGFNMVGIDMVRRKEQAPDVLPLDACAYRFSKDAWPLICRPDHSGWVYECINNALIAGATAFYVSKWENLDRDLGDLQEDIIFSLREVGIENEVLCIIRRIHD